MSARGTTIRRRVGGERGAAAVMIAMSSTVMFGMAALVIDTSALYQERRELQNGADAAALAVAEDCAYGDCGDTIGTATGLVNSNAQDAATAVDDVAVDTDAQTATVDTSTADADGGSVIAYTFARAFGFAGETVRASATARWGALRHGPAVPLVISKCEWDRIAGDPDRLPSGTAVLTFHDGNAAQECNGPAGQDLPGGFGWVDASGCVADVSFVDGAAWVGSDPGVNVPRSCSPGDFPLGEPVLIPIFDAKTGQGNTGQFRLIGFGAFVFDAYTLHPGQPVWTVNGLVCPLPAAGEPSPGPGPPAQGGGSGGRNQDAVCIQGHFDRFVELDGELADTGADDFGVRTVALVK